MPEQADEVDVLALMILLARVNQTILEVLISLMESQTGSIFPLTALRALADELNWVGKLVREKLPVTSRPVNQPCTKPGGDT